MSDFLPYGRHQLDEDDIKAVVDVLRNGILTGGPKAAEFEHDFASVLEVKEAVVCSNGTTALHLAIIAAGVTTGDQAIVPAITFLSTANVVRMAGADVIFADVDPDTGLLTPATFLEALSRADMARVKVVLPVWLNGQAEHAAEIYKIAHEYGLKVITDCAHALGADYISGGKPGDGMYEDIATFSLHPVKSIAMGEGGMVTTTNAALAERLRSLRSHDIQRDARTWKNKDLAFDKNGNANLGYYEMHELGYNYRATDFQCALGQSQLKKLDRFVARRRKIAEIYDQYFADSNLPLSPVRRSVDCQSAWHLYPVLIDYDALRTTRTELMKNLAGRCVGTQVHYVPVSHQPYYRDLYGVQKLPGVDRYYQRVLSLPIYPAMEEKDVGKVVRALREIL